jgi:hypothetical protein
VRLSAPRQRRGKPRRLPPVPLVLKDDEYSRLVELYGLEAANDIKRHRECELEAETTSARLRHVQQRSFAAYCEVSRLLRTAKPLAPVNVDVRFNRNGSGVMVNGVIYA